MLTKTLIRLNIQILNEKRIAVEMAIESCRKSNSSYSNELIVRHEKKLKGINQIIDYYKNKLDE